ncbi:MAG: coenzyme F420-0:L-glutamate ligase [Proteobacteria bacterium]|nr:coenzyme F420-0:L-glutamate ligase [Pseudomonadota bacterium]
MASAPNLQLWGLSGIPRVRAGDDLAVLLAAALRRADLELLEGDVVVVAQKIVSKAEGRAVPLSCVVPSAQALELAAEVQKDARLVELVLRESTRIVRKAKDVLIVEHRRGYVMANAGIDQSNVAAPGEEEWALLLPEDPDRSAQSLRSALRAHCGAEVGVALGCAGLSSVADLRGQPDLFGRTLRVTMVGHADEVAAAASLVMGQGAEGCPMVLVRGLARGGDLPAAALLRPPGEDLFR